MNEVVVDVMLWFSFRNTGPQIILMRSKDGNSRWWILKITVMSTDPHHFLSDLCQTLTDFIGKSVSIQDIGKVPICMDLDGKTLPFPVWALQVDYEASQVVNTKLEKQGYEVIAPHAASISWVRAKEYSDDLKTCAHELMRYYQEHGVMGHAQ